MKTKHYHNTNNLQSDDLKISIEKCKTQEEVIYNIFRNQIRLTPSKAWTIYEKATNKNVPITSIRRAISNLSKQNLLYKTEQTKRGIFGKPEHEYVLSVESIIIEKMNNV